MTTATAVRTGGLLQRLEQGFFKPYLGVQGGVLLRGKTFQALAAKSPLFAQMNNVLTLAPLWKWGLAIVPLTQVLTGKPAVENLDVNTSLSLAATGGIWAYYSTLIRPTAYSLMTVSVALFLSNGYNVYRRYIYEVNKAKTGQLTLAQNPTIKAPQTSTTLTTTTTSKKVL